METVGLYTNPTMILTGVQAEDAESVIRLLCDKAMDNGCIEPVFVQAILEREKEYPTGLPTMVPLAIPHIHDGCLRSFFSMAVLDEPVSFRCMGDPDEVIETRLVFYSESQIPVIRQQFSENSVRFSRVRKNCIR